MSTNSHNPSSSSLRPLPQLAAINGDFGEAREEIESALGSAGTTYYNDDAAAAKELAEVDFVFFLFKC